MMWLLDGKPVGPTFRRVWAAMFELGPRALLESELVWRPADPVHWNVAHPGGVDG